MKIFEPTLRSYSFLYHLISTKLFEYAKKVALSPEHILCLNFSDVCIATLRKCYPNARLQIIGFNSVNNLCQPIKLEPSDLIIANFANAQHEFDLSQFVEEINQIQSGPYDFVFATLDQNSKKLIETYDMFLINQHTLDDQQAILELQAIKQEYLVFTEHLVKMSRKQGFIDCHIFVISTDNAFRKKFEPTNSLPDEIFNGGYALQEKEREITATDNEMPEDMENSKIVSETSIDEITSIIEACTSQHHEEDNQAETIDLDEIPHNRDFPIEIPFLEDSVEIDTIVTDKPESDLHEEIKNNMVEPRTELQECREEDLKSSETNQDEVLIFERHEQIEESEDFVIIQETDEADFDIEADENQVKENEYAKQDREDIDLPMYHVFEQEISYAIDEEDETNQDIAKELDSCADVEDFNVENFDQSAEEEQDLDKDVDSVTDVKNDNDDNFSGENEGEYQDLDKTVGSDEKTTQKEDLDEDECDPEEDEEIDSDTEVVTDHEDDVDTEEGDQDGEQSLDSDIETEGNDESDFEEVEDDDEDLHSDTDIDTEEAEDIVSYEGENCDAIKDQSKNKFFIENPDPKKFNRIIYKDPTKR